MHKLALIAHYMGLTTKQAAVAAGRCYLHMYKGHEKVITP